MFESKETIDQNESKLIGTTSLPPIVDRFYGPLYQFAVRLTRSESDAADLVQQTFFTLIQHLHQIRDLSRSSAGCLRRSVGSSYERSVAERNIVR
jgi:Sigma-70 region 2